MTTMALVLCFAAGGWAAECAAPDNGSGTANLPAADCPFTSPSGDKLMITEGLPPGTTIESTFMIDSFFDV
ncbi:MAG TPA: hypothetical protein VMZ06_11535, partial [Candidatus Bathyarchaeia archaeon]|nr:hypothetical protein [Candidatus Bathyarchaeia archaeon]